jgi:flagellar hook protein FlgE
MGFEQGLSGLNSASSGLDVIGNNVANANTVGFKTARAEFADIYANSLAGTGASQVGLGAQVADVAQQFTQGGLTLTNNPLDLAINGEGFFRLSQNGSVTYTRNGQFQLDKNGFIINDNGGLRLQGYMANASGQIQTVLTDIQLPTSGSIPPQTTGGSPAGTGIITEVNLDSRLAAPTVPTFAFNNPSSFNNTTAISVFDSLGNSHTYTMYFVKASSGNAASQAAIVAGATAAQAAGFKTISDAAAGAGGTANDSQSVINATSGAATGAAAAAAINALTIGAGAGQVSSVAVQTAAANAASTGFVAGATGAQTTAAATAAGAVLAGQWNVYATVANPAGASSQFTDLSGGGTNPTPLTSLFFNTSGILTAPAGPVSQTITASQLGSLGINAANLTFNVDFSGSTEFGSSYVVNNLTQDGYASGTLAGFNVGADGIIEGRYTNGISQNLAQVTTDIFKNNQGLKSIGNNQWVETSESGNPITGTPSSGSNGALNSSATEDSTVNLTQELVNMIITQRVYQANAQTIKVQDEILQTLVTLR